MTKTDIRALLNSLGEGDKVTPDNGDPLHITTNEVGSEWFRGYFYNKDNITGFSYVIATKVEKKDGTIYEFTSLYDAAREERLSQH